MTLSDTYRRAELRGREAVARSRLTGGVWAARLFATGNAMAAVLAIVGPGPPLWRAGISLGIWSAGMVIAAERIENGGRLDAALLFAVFFLGDVVRWLSGRHSGVLSLLISVVVLFALGNAVWGTFALERIRRERETVPDVDPARPAV